jgi:predicted nucleic acid-binding protein
MTIFVDTSALLAVLAENDPHHSSARRIWARILDEQAVLFTTSYVVVETSALVQNRLGIEAAATLHRDILPVLEVEWVGPELHRAAVATLLAAGRRSLSLVDCASFEAMRTRGITTAFAFDRHFTEQGFTNP